MSTINLTDCPAPPIDDGTIKINLTDCPAPPIDDGIIKLEYSANIEKTQDSDENFVGNSNVSGDSYQTLPPKKPLLWE